MFSQRTILALSLIGLFGGCAANTAKMKTASSGATAADAGCAVTRYVRFRVGKTIAYGVVEGDRVRKISGCIFGDWKKTGTTYALKNIKILVPTRPSKVLALAGNYKDHLGDTPAHPHPEIFIKLPSCLQHHEGNIVLPKGNHDVHYEGELVIVIGKRARHVSEDQAMDCVLGVTCGIDVSARDWQNGDQKDVQWWRAKASDTFGPCGPYIASGLDYGHLDLQLRLNGEVRQKTNTNKMVHNLAQTVSFISQYVTLEPGDLIFTGTTGVTKPIKPGDVVEVEIEGVGVLRNKVVAAP